MGVGQSMPAARLVAWKEKKRAFSSLLRFVVVVVHA